MASVRVHRRQWLITDEPRVPSLESLASFRSIQIGPTLFLHYDDDLNVTELATATGGKAHVIGDAVADLSPDSPHDSVGRFVFVRDGKLSLDAAGSMGVYHSTEPSSVLASSSWPLLSRVLGCQGVGRGLQSSRMNWDPPPMSRLPGVRRLMLDEVLDLAAGRTTPRLRQVSGEVSVDTAASRLAECLASTATDLAAFGRPLVLSMTGGLDSRIVFAALVSAGVPFSAFTLLLDFERSRVDGKVAAELCRRYGVPHRAVHRARRSHGAARRQYLEHAGGVVGDRGISYATGDYYRDIPDDALLLHGGAFELGRRPLGWLLGNVDFSTEESALAGLQRAYGRLREPELAALREWHAFRARHPVVGMDYLELFFLDQRRAGWGAANRFEEDVFGFTGIVFANGWRTLDAMLSVGKAERGQGEVHLRALEVLLPGVATAAPLNPKLSVVREAWHVISSPYRRSRLMNRVRLWMRL